MLLRSRSRFPNFQSHLTGHPPAHLSPPSPALVTARRLAFSTLVLATVGSGRITQQKDGLGQPNWNWAAPSWDPRWSSTTGGGILWWWLIAQTTPERRTGRKDGPSAPVTTGKSGSYRGWISLTGQFTDRHIKQRRARRLKKGSAASSRHLRC
ncbi:hypothetical protein STH2218 [Symbiobacterium thermophilum IAM 14863]|uniref:Uncharacterized protein n=1 Tax=Symbiobacterium thermophilum (strain DSM 24528 / JCM 14929 / IAM 14863 / T) TaxID=292459 RepID=Q67M90_SYMTH|nr:hypothetical protein STH2218 [Symbiobacterium thermophilum IAM 14863]